MVHGDPGVTSPVSMQIEEKDPAPERYIESNLTAVERKGINFDVLHLKTAKAGSRILYKICFNPTKNLAMKFTTQHDLIFTSNYSTLCNKLDRQNLLN